LSPGLRFFHQGQLEGREKRISPHLIRAPHEFRDEELQTFYSDLLSVIKQPLFRDGQWKLLECVPAWDGNGSWDSFIAFAWEEQYGRRAVIVVNYAPHASQCYLRLPFSYISDHRIEFRDLMTIALYYRDGNDLLSQGIFLDLPPWGYHAFEVSVMTSEML
jgi:hypothetical protein